MGSSGIGCTAGKTDGKLGAAQPFSSLLESHNCGLVEEVLIVAEDDERGEEADSGSESEGGATDVSRDVEDEFGRDGLAGGDFGIKAWERALNAG
jgi:hypothetical protein